MEAGLARGLAECGVGTCGADVRGWGGSRTLLSTTDTLRSPLWLLLPRASPGQADVGGPGSRAIGPG